MNLKEALCAIPDVKAVLIELNGAESHLLASSAEAQFEVEFEDGATAQTFVIDGKASRLAKIMPADTEITVRNGKIRLDAGQGVYQYHLLPHSQPVIGPAPQKNTWVETIWVHGTPPYYRAPSHSFAQGDNLSGTLDRTQIKRLLVE